MVPIHPEHHTNACALTCLVHLGECPCGLATLMRQTSAADTPGLKHEIIQPAKAVKQPCLSTTYPPGRWLPTRPVSLIFRVHADWPLAALILCGAHRADRVMIQGRWTVEEAMPVGVDVERLRLEHGAQARAFLEAVYRHAVW